MPAKSFESTLLFQILHNTALRRIARAKPGESYDEIKRRMRAANPAMSWPED